MEVASRLEPIRRLCSFEGRLAGTDAERRAANDLARALRDQGRKAEVEPTYVHPQPGLVHAVHCALGIAGSLLAGVIAPLAFALVLAAATAMYLDASGRLYLVRRLFFRRASQNVLARGSAPERPARLVLCAHYDAGRTGAAFGPRWTARAASIQRLLGLPVAGLRVPFWSLALLLPVLGARMAGIDGTAVAALQLPQTLALIVAVFALVEHELSPISPGANDNASGVATALSVAAELDRDPPEHLDVWVLLIGGGEALVEGMRRFLRGHRDELREGPTTYFLNLDSVGGGEVRYLTAEGLVVGYGMDRDLIELCEALGADGGRAAPLRYGFATDALPARLAGHPAITITGLEHGALLPSNSRGAADTPDRIDPDALEHAHDFARDLARLLDREAGRRRLGHG